MRRFLTQLTEEIKKTISFGQVGPMPLSSPIEPVSVEFFTLQTGSGLLQQGGPRRLDTGACSEPQTTPKSRLAESEGRPEKACFLPFHLDLRGDLCYFTRVF